MTNSEAIKCTCRSEVAAELAGFAPLLTFRGLVVYTFSGDDLPATMHEIGRLRERIFRSEGAGRGGSCDLDELDFGKFGYRQLIAYDPGEEELVALYRYQPGRNAVNGGEHYLRTSSLFEYSGEFRKNIIPYAIELGRSVVNKEAKRSRFGLYAIWKGLIALLDLYPECRYFFGNVTLYRTINPQPRDLLVNYLHTYYTPPQVMLKARNGIRHLPECGAIPSKTGERQKDTPQNRISQLRSHLAAYGEVIPPIIQSYMSLGNFVWFGETAVDSDFGDALETGIIVPADKVTFG